MIEGSNPFSYPLNYYISEGSFSGVDLEKAKKTYWGLGDRFWMQIIDGKFHVHGAMVFDEALHKGDKEPGFFASLQEGCRFASEHLGEKPTIHFYKELHKKLCSHFKGEETATLMSAKKTGVFRTDFARIGLSLKNAFSKDATIHYTNVTGYENEDILKALKEINPIKHERICNEYSASKKWVREWEEKWEMNANELDNYVSEICNNLNISKFATILISSERFIVNYEILDPKEHEEIVQLFFDKYNQKIEELNNKLKNAGSETEIQKIMDEKLEAIANLYQMLDWQHPFIDGQGRTDLVLLSKLLTEEGFNPAILDEPYFSSWSSLKDWKAYLIQGMQRWQEEAIKGG